MQERDQGQIPFQEISLAPEDYANIAEIVTLVNQVVSRQYRNFRPLEIGHVKFVPNLSKLEQSSAVSRLHPFFLEKIGDRANFGAPSEAQSWADTTSDITFFSPEVIEDMRKNKSVGYLGIGLDLIDASISLGSERVLVESEQATKMAVDMVTANYKSSLRGIVAESDLDEALQYLNKKGSKIRIRGLSLAIIVEDKMFLPSTGLNSNAIIMRYLSKPVRSDFARVVANEFNLSFNQRSAISRYAETSAPLDIELSGKDPRQLEREILGSVDRMGFRGRSAIERGYQNGDIGKKIIEDYR